MRINVYDEEITGEVERVIKRADTGKTFVGVRIFLDSPDSLHHNDDDDDRSAITFWFEDENEDERLKVMALFGLATITAGVS